jgi:hypothetical protein
MAKKINTVKGVTIQGKVDAVAYVKANGYPEVGQFADEKSLQKFYKQLSQEQLDAWVELEGLTYKPCTEQPAIHWMRACMAILRTHFPVEHKAKKESPYKQYTTEALVAMAVEHDVAFEVCEDDRILRMRAIMALRANKVIG